MNAHGARRNGMIGREKTLRVTKYVSSGCFAPLTQSLLQTVEIWRCLAGIARFVSSSNGTVNF